MCPQHGHAVVAVGRSGCRSCSFTVLKIPGQDVALPLRCMPLQHTRHVPTARSCSCGDRKAWLQVLKFYSSENLRSGCSTSFALCASPAHPPCAHSTVMQFWRLEGVFAGLEVLHSENLRSGCSSSFALRASPAQTAMCPQHGHAVVVIGRCVCRS